MLTELQARYDGRKSFYKKAMVESNGNDLKLYSYNTLVAEFKDNKPIIHGFYSMTTLRHQKEFLKQLGFEASSKKQMEQYLV